MIKQLFYYMIGYKQICCPNCKTIFYLEKSRFRQGDICCSERCMYDKLDEKLDEKLDQK